MTTAISAEQMKTIVHEELADLVSIRHDLHAHPELGYEERRTSEIVRRELDKAGVSYVADMAGGTGVLAHLPGESDRAIALRADMDALPILEENDVEYRSTIDGVMHACGHDGHTTVLIGAARVLARLARMSALPRPVTFIFQPAEEGGAGGQRMVQEGCLDGSRIGPAVENAFGLHGWPRLPLGVVATRPGVLLAAADSFDLTIHGKGSHAAWPHMGCDPIVAAAAIVGAFQSIVTRSVDPLDSVVISVTQLQAGNTYNVIPGTAKLAGTVRSLTPQVRDLLRRRMQTIADGIAQAHRCTAELDYHDGYPPTVNDPEAVSIFRAVSIEAIGPDHVHEMERPVMGGEDFAFYGQVVPACFFVLGLVPAGVDDPPDLHQPSFNFNDDAIPLGIELFCRLALRE
ncbi:MAG: amidohydrolase [Planctomycetes bacterium]|nr:amidohydrolase [Planctomycetota bacterium]